MRVLQPAVKTGTERRERQFLLKLDRQEVIFSHSLVVYSSRMRQTSLWRSVISNRGTLLPGGTGKIEEYRN